MSRERRHTAPPGGGGGRAPGSRRATAAVLGTVAVAAAGWLATPWITMRRRGTLDEQQVRSWRDEPGPAPPIPLPRRPLAPERTRVV